MRRLHLSNFVYELINHPVLEKYAQFKFCKPFTKETIGIFLEIEYIIKKKFKQENIAKIKSVLFFYLFYKNIN